MEERKNEQVNRQIRELTGKIQEKENELLRYVDKNNELEEILNQRQEETKKNRMQIQEQESSLEEMKNEIFKLKNNKRVEVEQIKMQCQKDYERKISNLTTNKVFLLLL